MYGIASSANRDWSAIDTEATRTGKFRSRGMSTRSPYAPCVQRGLLRGIAVFRWGAWAWTAVVLLLQRDEFEHPSIAVAVVALTLTWTVIATVLVERAPH